MKRRSFLKGLLGLTAVSVAGCMRPPEAKAETKRPEPVLVHRKTGKETNYKQVLGREMTATELMLRREEYTRSMAKRIAEIQNKAFEKAFFNG